MRSPLSRLVIVCAAVAAFGAGVSAQSAPAAPPADRPLVFRVVTTGQGRPMILIPGLLSSGSVWDGAVEHFKARYECHVLTLAGFAGEPAATLVDGQGCLATVARDVGPVVAVDGVPFLTALMNPAADAGSVRGQAEFAKDDDVRGRVRASYEAQVAAVGNRRVVLAETARHFIM